MDASIRLFERLYFGVQILRGGVDRSQIEFARDLLNSSREIQRRHVSSRLIQTHAAPSAALAWLDRQPPCDPGSLRDEMKARIATESRRRVEVRKTSGSTGAPFQFVKDKNMTAMMDATMWAVYGWHGIQPGQRHARFWGMPRDLLPKMKRQLMDALLHRRRLDAFDIDRETARQFFMRLRRFRPSYVHAYPNLLLEFIEYCTVADFDGTDLGVSTVVCGGELLPPSSRQTIQEFFGARVVNEYGCSESGLLSIDCEAGRPHLLPVAAYPQLIDTDRDDGTLSGEVVITDLYGSIAPLLRYRLHDRAVMSDASCECGRDLPVLSPVIGRVDSFIQTPSKLRVYDAILAYSVPKDVLRFRAYQINSRTLFVEAIVGPVDSPGDVLRELESRWCKELGEEMEVKAVLVEDLSLMESGKLAYFVPENEVSPSVRARALQS